MDRQEKQNFWPFADPRSTAVYTSRNVVKEGLPVLFVSHDSDDGAWQFYPAESAPDGDSVIVALDEIISLDPGIADIADLPRGWIARRGSAAAPWRRRPIHGKEELLVTTRAGDTMSENTRERDDRPEPIAA